MSNNLSGEIIVERCPCFIKGHNIFLFISCRIIFIEGHKIFTLSHMTWKNPVNITFYSFFNFTSSFIILFIVTVDIIKDFDFCVSAFSLATSIFYLRKKLKLCVTFRLGWVVVLRPNVRLWDLGR